MDVRPREGKTYAMMGHPVALEIETPRRGLWRRRRGNRRAVVQRRSLLPVLAGALARFGRAGLRVGRVVGKVILLLALCAGLGWGGRLAMRHVVDSPRFQIRKIDFTSTPHIGRDEVLALAGVSVGDKLLGVDTDAVAARIAAHPWVAVVRSSRRLPSSLVLEVIEKNAVAVASLAALYLVDEGGHPFKRATMEEADGLPVLTGIERPKFAQMPEVSAAAFHEALAVLAEYRARPRPEVGEINIDPGFGYSLFLLEGGAEIRLGRDNLGKKLAQLDQIFEAMKPMEMGGHSALRVVHLDVAENGRVPVLLRASGVEPSAPPKSPPPKIAKN